MNEKQTQAQTSRFMPVLTASILLVSVGVLGLMAFVLFTVPLLGPRWLLFFLVTMLFSGLALPVVFYLHLRFPSNPPVSGRVITREAIFVGIYADILLWLQISKVLNFALVLFITIGFIAIELIIRMTETSRFNPYKTKHD